jgi:hypothetical protein
MADFLPKSNGGLASWLNNYGTKLPTYAVLLSLTPAEQAALVKACADAHDAVELKNAKWNEYLSSIAASQQTIDDATALIRGAVRRQKASAGYTDAIGADLAITGSGSPVDPTAIKPLLTATVVPGAVMIRVKRKGATSSNLYSRLAGQTQWKLVKWIISSPYADTTPLAQPNVPERREYAVRGLINDAEVGELSDVVSVVFAG